MYTAMQEDEEVSSTALLSAQDKHMEEESGELNGKEMEVEEQVPWPNQPVTVTIFWWKWHTTNVNKFRYYMGLLLVVLLVSSFGQEVIASMVARLGERQFNVHTSIDNAYAYIQFLENLLLSGVTAIVGQQLARHGFGEALGRWVRTAFLVATFYGVIGMVVYLGARDLIFTNVFASQTDLRTDPAATVFWNLQAVSVPLKLLANVCGGVAFGMYDLPLYTMASSIGTAFSVVFAALTVAVGNLGLEGAGLASVFGNSVVVGFVIAWLAKRQQYKPLNIFTMELPPPRALLAFLESNVYLIGYELSSNLVIDLLVPLSVMLGPHQEAAVGVLKSLKNLVRGICMAISLSAVMMGSRMFASGRMNALHRFLKVTVALCFSLMLPLAIMSVISPRAVVKSFTGDIANLDQIQAQLDSIWSIFVLMLVVTAFKFPYAGILYATGQFRFMCLATLGAGAAYGVLTALSVVNRDLVGLVLAVLVFSAIQTVAFAYRYHFYVRKKYPEGCKPNLTGEEEVDEPEVYESREL